MAAPFVLLALAVQDKLHIADNQGRGMLMRFCKIYPPEKIARITEAATEFPWWEKNPTAAFMKALGQINKEEKSKI